MVEVEALSITADECVTALPRSPSGRYRRTLARPYALVGKTAGRASAALERGRSSSPCAQLSGGPGRQALTHTPNTLTLAAPDSTPPAAFVQCQW